MMQDEFERLTGKPIDSRYYPRIELVYMWAAETQTMSKQQFADEFNARGWEWIHNLQNDPNCEPYMDNICYSSEDEFSTFDVNMRGYVRNVKPKSIRTVFNWVKAEVSKTVDLEQFDYFQISCSEDREGGSWPLNARIACFAVTGGSEGHYVHVDALSSDGNRNLILGKTFLGFDHALELAGALSKLLA